ncbi:hypothetical protein CRG98_044359, partial [Punica granatum]
MDADWAGLLDAGWAGLTRAGLLMLTGVSCAIQEKRKSTRLERGRNRGERTRFGAVATGRASRGLRVSSGSRELRVVSVDELRAT